MDRKEILHCLTDKNAGPETFQRADQIRRNYVGDCIQIRGVVHFSNYCCRNDLYCGLRKDNPRMKRFRMSEDQIVATALSVAKAGIKTIVLQSGEDYFYTRDLLCSVIRKILDRADVAITLSLGERPFKDFDAFKKAGATRYLMKHETMNPKLYAQMRPGLHLEDRLAAISYLREIGFQVGVGNIVGLPGQTMDDLCSDIEFLQDFQPDMVNIGPFLPDRATPLGNSAPGDIELMLRVFALARIVTRNTHLAAANTVATLAPEHGQYRAIVQGGANVIMPNCNPFRKSQTDKIEYEFQITTKKRYVSLDEALDVVTRAQRYVARDKGDSLKQKGENLA